MACAGNRRASLFLKTCLFVVALVLLLANTGPNASAQSLLLTLDIPNPQEDAHFGDSLAIGDVDGDGKADIVVGAPYEDVGGNLHQGRAYVFSGADGSVLHTLDTPNPQGNGWFGESVAVGDVNGDGKADIAVGAGGESNWGCAYVFSGADGSLLLTLQTPNPGSIDPGFGESVAVEEVNGDGKADIAVGAPYEDVGSNLHQGRAYVFSGADGSLLFTLNSPNPQWSGTFGVSVALGDVNGDVKADIAVGASGENYAARGRAYVFSGGNGSLLFTLNTSNPQVQARFGNSVAAGDVNGDGKADIAVGAPCEDVGGNTDQGRAYVFSGADGSLLFTLNTPNPQAYARFGASLALGDVDGDSESEVAVAAYDEDVAGNTDQGRAYIFSDVDGSLLLILNSPNPQADADFGRALAMGDVNANGTADIAVGPPYEDVAGNANQGRVYIFSWEPPPDVLVTAIEVTQAIQDLQNSVPLVEDKPTFVRVYVRSDGAPVDVRGQLQGVDALDQPLPGSPLSPVNTQPVTAEAEGSENRRQQLWDSLLFELPPDWRHGDITLTAQLTIDSEVVAESLPHAVTFHSRRPLNIAMVRIWYLWPFDCFGCTPPEEAYDRALTWLRRVYPVGDINTWHMPRLMVDYPLSNRFGQDLLLLDLWEWRVLHSAPASPLHYLGIIHEDIDTESQGSTVYGNARQGGLEAWIKDDTVLWDWSSKKAAHEIGHNLGRKHAPCWPAGEDPPADIDPGWPADHPSGRIGTGDLAGAYGFDSKGHQVLSPSVYTDFMGYCGVQWVSDYTYEGLFDRLDPTAMLGTGSLLGEAAIGQATSSTSEYLLVSGLASPSVPEADIRPIFRTDTPAEAAESEPGPYTLELRDGSGGVLVSQTFDAWSTEGETQAEPLAFARVLPYHDDAATLVLLYEGQELASEEFTGSAPQVTVTHPNGGESLSGTATVTWEATDLDGDPLTYVVLYSHDAGTTWQAVAVGLESTAFELDTTMVSGGEVALVKVQASDGALTGEDTSDALFTVAAKAPSVSIVEPTVPGPFASGDAVTLAGFGFDPEDGPLPDGSLSWQSDIDGALGSGEELVTTSLSVGLHTITLTGEDTDQNTGTAQTSVEVVAEPADSDSDDLTDVRELTIGTDRYDPDSDGDQLSDGAEVDVWGTDPLNADTDGDGFTDGIEVYVGTDAVDNCADDASHDAWPPDMDNDRDADIVDVLAAFKNKILIPAAYDPRSDFDTDGDLDIVDVIAGYKGTILTSCTP